MFQFVLDVKGLLAFYKIETNDSRNVSSMKNE